MKNNGCNLKRKTHLLRKRICILVQCLILGAFLSSLLFSMYQGEYKNINVSIPKASTTHSPISIDGNAALDAFCVGKGTDGLSWDTAHVIEDLEIDAEGVGSGIDIRNTNRFLIIRRCTIINSGNSTITIPSWMIYADSGIFLYSVNNVKIIKCNVNNNYVGISLVESNYNNISDNVASSNRHKGIILVSACNNTISGNEASYNSMVGIGLKYYSSFNTISGNTFSHNDYNGFKLENKSENNTISDNHASYNGQYGIYLDSDSDNNEIYQNSLCYNEIGDIQDLGENNNIHDNDDCSQPVIPNYPIAWISVIVLCSVAVSIYVDLKRLKK